MSRRVRRSPLVAVVALAVWLVLPSGASAHAYLVKTVPAASVVLDAPPPNIQLTYDEAVEPRLAIISVTDADGHQETTGSVHRSPANPDTLVVPLRTHLPEGWYLIFWRAISVDGHPVEGAFTYAIGPNPGPAPQFRVPNISATAVTPELLVARWVMFVAVMAAIGLFVMRLLTARPLVREVEGSTLRALSIAFTVAAVVGLAAIPVYLDFSTANDSLRSVFDFSALVPLFRVTAFGRAIVDLEVCFALFCLAAGIALWVDRPDRERRSIAELVASCGALLAAAAVLVVPGAAGHAAQTSPRGLTLLFDWLHMASGSVWLGGLVGLLVLWFTVSARQRVAALSVCVPRFSNVAAVSVLVLGATGVGEAINHMPAVNALWETSYGQAILVKAGLLGAALVIASGNLLRSRPRLIAARRRPEVGEPAARLLRGLVSGELMIVVAVVFAAAVLSSLPPPPPAFALENSAIAKVGPGRVAETVRHAGYVLQVLVSPNKAAAPDSFALRITKGGQPVRGADVTLLFNHLEMQMPTQEYQLTETQPGIYSRAAPALVMVGRWGLTFQVTPKLGLPFTALIVDQADG
ncbi:MAG TPA: copper resistance protein CopC [Solirubrobacteraceae bacterium]|nr:copper resistance protein CopC [Solirubrobacteraceae bacterium]